MVLVRFVKNWRIYNSGEQAGWDEDFAKKLVEEYKVAEYVAAEGEVTPPPGDDDDDNHDDVLTKTKFMRLNAEDLIKLAAEKDIDLGGRVLKKDVQPFLKEALFPDAE